MEQPITPSMGRLACHGTAHALFHLGYAVGRKQPRVLHKGYTAMACPMGKAGGCLAPHRSSHGMFHYTSRGSTYGITHGSAYEITEINSGVTHWTSYGTSHSLSGGLSHSFSHRLSHEKNHGTCHGTRYRMTHHPIGCPLG